MPSPRADLAALFFILGAAGSLPAAPAFILTPSPNISGPAGSTIGWGFTLSVPNDGTGYIEINSAEFCLSPITDPCTPSDLGTFTDFISAVNDVIVGPPDTISQSFDAIAQTGVGSFQISPGASGTNVGSIVLHYRETNLDPFDPNAVPINPDVVLTVPASITVTAAAATPEPCTAGLLAISFGMLFLNRKRKEREP